MNAIIRLYDITLDDTPVSWAWCKPHEVDKVTQQLIDEQLDQGAMEDDLQPAVEYQS